VQSHCKRTLGFLSTRHNFCALPVSAFTSAFLLSSFDWMGDESGGDSFMVLVAKVVWGNTFVTEGWWCVYRGIVCSP